MGASDLTIKLLDQYSLAELMAWSVDPQHSRLAFRAAWALEHILLDNPHLFTSLYPEILKNYSYTMNWSSLRSYTKLLMWILSDKNQAFTCTELEEEAILEKTFAVVEDRACPVAVLVNGFDILKAMIPNYPWVAQELQLLLELHLEKEPSAALKSRGHKLMKHLAKLSARQRLK